MIRDTEGLHARQRAALPHFIKTANKSKIARLAGVNRTTVYRWLAEPDFARAVIRLYNEELGKLRERVTRPVSSGQSGAG